MTENTYLSASLLVTSRVDPFPSVMASVKSSKLPLDARSGYSLKLMLLLSLINKRSIYINQHLTNKL